MASSFDFISDSNSLPEQYPSVPQQYTQSQNNREGYTNSVSAPNYSNFKPITDDNAISRPIEKTVVNQLPEPSHKKRKKKDDSDEIVKAKTETGTVEDTNTISSYYETSMMLANAMQQIDTVANDIKQELDTVRTSRTLHNKYNTVVGLASNLSDLFEAKVGAIKELNNCITKSNDLDYKRAKDRKDAEGAANDDKRIMDLYTAFVKNPMANSSMSSALGPTASDNLYNIDMVKVADQPVGSFNPDKNFTNYVANMTPEQNAMLYEQNPNIKQCVVFDSSTGNKWFQVMNTETGQVIPNAPVHDSMFMSDTTIDIKNHIAKNINLNETYPLVIINDDITKNY